MNNKDLDLYLKFIFDYVQKYIELSKDFDSIEKKYGVFSTEKKFKKTSNVKAIHVLENFVADNIDIDIQQRLLISNLIDSIDNSSANDKKIADCFIETIGKQNVTRKKNLLEKLKLGLNIINEFMLSNDTSFQEIVYLCKSNKEPCSVKNCHAYSTKKEYDDNFDDCKDRKESIRVREQLDLKEHNCYRYCKLNHTHKILPEEPKDETQSFLSINIYPSTIPEQADTPFKVCSIENCICCSIKYMDEKNCSIEKIYDKKLYNELTSEDSEKKCKYMKIYEAQEDKKIKLSNRLESIIEDVEVLESKLNRIENIVKELKKKIEK